ncbi:MAG TPA: hypothetical protein VLT36_07690 [Candidatus Dormibacteraeota bacterium]|nr:hypothetical protein [Candidatus Dormibacteraeota bacterium]
MSDQLFPNEIAGRHGNDLAATPGIRMRHVIYLAATGTATIGWFWLIAWAAIRVTQ